jgi:copper(I)-binding protein
MSKVKRRLICAALLSCLLLSAARAEEANIAVTQTWIRATPGGSRVAGGYLVIENRGPVVDKLLSASTEAAGRSKFTKWPSLTAA